MIPSSITYFAITRGKAPKARGCVPDTEAGFTGEASVSIITYGARSAAHFCSSFMLSGLTPTPPACTRSKKAFQGSVPSTPAASATDRFTTPGPTASGAETISTLFQSIPTCWYQFSHSESVSTSWRSRARRSASPRVARKAPVPRA